MIASVYKEDMAVAIGSMFSHSRPFITNFYIVTYLFRTTGQVLGVSLSGTVLQAVLLRKLRERIHGPAASEARWTFSEYMSFSLSVLLDHRRNKVSLLLTCHRHNSIVFEFIGGTRRSYPR